MTVHCIPVVEWITNCGFTNRPTQVKFGMMQANWTQQKQLSQLGTLVAVPKLFSCHRTTIYIIIIILCRSGAKYREQLERVRS